jgi:prepilin-type N-terminal cleavage/methylation domain-containing protein
MIFKNKGFTLIELLVVIAIIGILSSIVLGNLNVGRARSADAAMLANLSQIRSQAELFFSVNGNYGTVYLSGACPTISSSLFVADATVRRTVESISNLTNDVVYCAAGSGAGTQADSWAIAGRFSSKPGYGCVDSRGAVTTAQAPWWSWFVPEPVFAAVAMGPNLGGGSGNPARCP